MNNVVPVERRRRSSIDNDGGKVISNFITAVNNLK